MLLEKGRVHAEFQRQRAPQVRANLADQFAHEALRALGVVDVAGAVLEPQDLPGLRQVGKQRVVTGVLGMMRVKAPCGPAHFTTGTDDGAVEVDRQTPQRELLNLLIEQFAVKRRISARSEVCVNCLSQLTTVRSLGMRARPQNRANNESLAR